MKKMNRRILFASVLILAIACTVGFSCVSALSADGESLLSGLVSAGSTVGVDLSSLIGSFVPSGESTSSSSGSVDAGPDLDRLFAGVNMSMMDVLDLVNYLQRGGSFETWMTDRFGSDLEIPASVKEMSTDALIQYLFGMVLYPDETHTTTKKYVFTTSETETTADGLTTERPATTASQGGNETVTTAPVSGKPEEHKPGDVDFDGLVTARDARLALRAGASIETLSEAAAEAADVNGDGRVTARDARSILRYVAGLASSF